MINAEDGINSSAARRWLPVLTFLFSDVSSDFSVSLNKTNHGVKIKLHLFLWTKTGIGQQNRSSLNLSKGYHTPNYRGVFLFRWLKGCLCLTAIRDEPLWNLFSVVLPKSVASAQHSSVETIVEVMSTSCSMSLLTPAFPTNPVWF